MTRLCCTLILPAAFTAFVTAAPGLKQPPGPTKDRDGNPLPKGATARLGSYTFRSPGMYGLTFSPDGKKLTAATEDGRVFDWEAGTGKPRVTASFKLDRERALTSGAMGGDRVVWIQAPTIGVRGEKSKAVVYALGTRKEVSRFEFGGRSPSFNVIALETYNVSLTPDGRYFAAIVDNGRAVEVYDLDTGRRLHEQRVTLSRRVHAGEDSRTLYFTDAGKLQRCELTTGKELPAVADADDSIDLLRASPDGKRLVTRGTFVMKDEQQQIRGTGYDPFLVVRDTAANKTLGKLELGGKAADFRFLGPDALVVFTIRYRPPLPPVHTLSRWNLATLTRDWEVPGPPAELYGLYGWLAASPDGSRFAVTDRQCIAVVYDSATGKPIGGQDAHSGPVAWVGFAPDGRHVVTAAQDGTRTWTLEGELKNAVAPPEFARGRVQPGLVGEHLVWVAHAEGGKKPELVGWDRAKGAIGWRMPLDDPLPDRVISSDGKRCVGFSLGKGRRVREVTVYDGPAGKVLHSWVLPVHLGGEGTPFTLAPGGDVLFVTRGIADPDGRDGGAVQIVGLDVTNGNEKVRIDAGRFAQWYNAPGPFPMAVSADGSKLALVGRYPQDGNHGLFVFDTGSGQKRAEHDLGPAHQPALRFSPDGKEVAVWNMWSSTVQVCDAESGKPPPRKLEGGTGRATVACFSPDGTSLAVGYQDGTALLWDLTAK